MSTVTLKGNTFNTIGELPKVGSSLPKFNLVKNARLAHEAGCNLILYCAGKTTETKKIFKVGKLQIHPVKILDTYFVIKCQPLFNQN